MAGFRITNRAYTGPIDLGVAERSYNKLEAAHQATVSNASAAKVSLAALDLNAEEDAWRQQQIAKIDSAINDNLLYGNAASAMDDVTAALGNISSDPGMIGRLRAQKQYTEWQTKLDNSGLNEDYKNYYRKANNYSYSDIKDDKGKIIGGSEWKPTEDWVTEVPLSDLIANGIKIAAADAGGGSQTRFLDANGQVTTDPSQAFDGQVFDTTTNEWVRLSPEKIQAGIKAYIESTPGAKASLEQDYKVAVSKYKENGNVNPDVTDSNGVLLSQDQYLSKRVNPAVQAAQYSKNVSKTTYGTGLATYKAAKAAVSAGSASNPYGDLTSLFNQSSPNSEVRLEYDTVGNLKSNISNSRGAIKNILSTMSGQDINFGPNTDITEMETKINDILANYNGSDKAAYSTQLGLYLQNFKAAQTDYNEITKGLDENQKIDIDFVTRIDNGGELIAGNESDDKVLNVIKSNIFPEGVEKVAITFDDPEFATKFKDVLSGGDAEGYKQLGMEMIQDNNGSYRFVINRDNYNLMPLLSNILSSAEEKRNTGVGSTIGSWFFDRYKAIPLDANNNEVKVMNIGRKQNVSADRIIKQGINSINRTYNNANKAKNKALEATVPSHITTSNYNLPFGSFTQAHLMDMRTKGLIDNATFNLYNKVYSEDVARKISTNNYASTPMYIADKNSGKILGRVDDSNIRSKVGLAIRAGMDNKTVQYNPTAIPTQGTGVNFNITPNMKADGTLVNYFDKIVKEAKGGDNYITEDGEAVIFVPGILDERVGQLVINDPSYVAAEKVAIADGTRTTVPIFNSISNPSIGNITLKGMGQGMFSVSTPVGNGIIDRQQAGELVKIGQQYNMLKVQALTYNNNPSAITPAQSAAMKSTLQNIAIGLAGIYRTDNVSAVYGQLIDDLGIKPTK